MNTFEMNSGQDIHPGRKEQLLEVLVFIFLFVPSIILSFFVTQQGSPGFILVATETILQNLALVGLIIYFVWRNGEPLALIGWSRRQAWKEAGLGIVLFIPFVLVTGLVEQVFIDLGLSTPETNLPSFLAARGGAEFVLAFFLVAVVAVAEETIYRGYLLLRFAGVTRSPVAAVLISSAIFSLGHSYEGLAGVATVGVIGLIFAVIYIWRRSLIAPVIMHFLQDFIGIIVAPLIGS